MLKHHILTTNIELTDAISDYLAKKIGAVEKFIDKEVESLAKIEVGRTTRHHNKGDIFRAEINLTVGDKSYRAVAEMNDLYAAIDKVKDEIVSEVNKANKKRLHLLRRGHLAIKKFIRKVNGSEDIE